MCFGRSHPSRIWVAIHWSMGDVFACLGNSVRVWDHNMSANFWFQTLTLGMALDYSTYISDGFIRYSQSDVQSLHSLHGLPMIQLAYCYSFTTNKQELHVRCTLLAYTLTYFWWFLQLWITQDFLSQVVKYFRRGLMMIAVLYIHWCRTLWCLNNLTATKIGR